MDEERDPYVAQVDDLDSVSQAFIAWAGDPAAIRLLYTPDVLLAVDSTARRGFLLDEVYFSTLWADRGVTELRISVEAALSAAGKDRPRPGVFEPNAHDLIAAALRHGSALS